MRICIDISQIVYSRGVGRYTRELVSHLLKIDAKDEYILFGSSLRQQQTLKNFIQKLEPKTYLAETSSAYHLKPKLYPIPPTILEFLFNRIHFSIDKFVGRADVFHSSDWTQPSSAAKKVTTIHDMIAAKFPKLFDQKTIAVQKRRLNWAKKEVDKIIAVSENTKKDIIEILQIPDEKIEVIYEAASRVFYPRGEEEIEDVRKKFGISGDYILTVTTRSSQKLSNLLGAFKTIRKDFDIDLVVVGENPKNSENLIKVEMISDEDLARIYSGAKVFVFPSFYEGFGLPVLEAMASGVPVVVSNTSSLPEVTGEAAVYIEPDSGDSIADGIKKVLMNKKFAQELTRLSLAQATKFSWGANAQKTLKVYQDVFKS